MSLKYGSLRELNGFNIRQDYIIFGFLEAFTLIEFRRHKFAIAKVNSFRDLKLFISYYYRSRVKVNILEIVFLASQVHLCVLLFLVLLLYT